MRTVNTLEINGIRGAVAVKFGVKGLDQLYAKVREEFIKESEIV